MWFWYGAAVVHLSKEMIVARRPALGAEYLAVANKAKSVRAWLHEEYTRLLTEQKNEQAK
jgi:hypothetical protein